MALTLRDPARGSGYAAFPPPPSSSLGHGLQGLRGLQVAHAAQATSEEAAGVSDRDHSGRCACLTPKRARSPLSEESRGVTLLGVGRRRILMAGSGRGAQPGEAPPVLDVFISYRREDADAAAGRLYDTLSPRFGEEHVFMDVDAIPLGLDFTSEITKRIESCDVLIALLGRDWLTITDEEGQRRLDDPEDFVRIEIEAALKRDVPVIPAFVQGVRMPKSADLPSSLKPLAVRNGIELRHGAWRSDVDRLVEALERLAAEKAKRLAPKRSAAKKRAERTKQGRRPTKREPVDELVPDGPGEPRPDPEPSWTVEAISKTHNQRVLRVQLTHARHVVAYNVGALSATLRVDDVVVTRKYSPTGDGVEAPTVEVPFQLADGDAQLPCTFAAYYATWSIKRALLTVDGRVLYDEGEQ